LSIAELKDPELLPHWSKPNPHKSTWNDMMLYVREMVEEYAFKKWDGPEGLDAEYERREAQKKDKKDKKFKEKLADLRRRTMTSTWERKRQEGPHKHEFDDSVEDQDGNTTQTCKTCGLVIESEEF
jgi:DNA-repair protein complementing XP-A cells